MKFNTKSGFSLFELLAGIMVMSVLLTALYVVFNQASRVSTSGDDDADLQQNLRITAETLAVELATAISQPASASGVTKPHLMGVNNTLDLNFAGGSADVYNRDTIAFCIPDGNGISEVGYGINGDANTAAHNSILNRSYTASAGGAVDYVITDLTADFTDQDLFAFKICGLNVTYEYFDVSTNSWQQLDEWDSSQGPNTTVTTADDERLPDFITITIEGVDSETSLENNRDPDQILRTFVTTQVRMPERRGSS